MAAAHPRLRERVIFQRRTAATPPSGPAVSDGMGGGSDGMGGVYGEWDEENPIAELRARLQPLQGREEVLTQRLSGIQPFLLTVRRCAASLAVTDADRVVNARSGASYDISSIMNPDERDQYLTMLVTSGKPSDG